MPILYRGAAPGTYWHIHDARLSGFTAIRAGTPSSPNLVVDHIASGRTNSPFISLTWSPGIARDYAIVGPGGIATPTNPGYIYVIDIPEPLPSHLIFFDPVREIALGLPPFPQMTPYQHEGDQNFLLGIVKPNQFNNHLLTYRLTFQSLAHSPATPSRHLLTLVHALRDAEILACVAIPSSFVIDRVDVY